ncbi:PREDICTED: uncharacterized protein LOC104798910 [Tarenaya hassleriana]|uniref:uncharacterized protein LOC104798910 n=1 Tax=Tarenaya hassleriana TaxID=28532 RepID=UPI00053C1A5B|nr:PREDICTED: uncharacterized protein LOC104798910 [Tarenaya hassleriana]
MLALFQRNTQKRRRISRVRRRRPHSRNSDCGAASNQQVSLSSHPPTTEVQSKNNGNPSTDMAQEPATWSKRLFPNKRNLERLGTPGLHVTGIPLISIPEESINQAVDEWKDFLIGQFYGLPPSLGRIIGVVNALWNRNGNRIRVQDIGKGTFLFKVPNENTRQFILSRQFWYIGQCPMFVSSWNPHHTLDKPPMQSISTWVTLLDVPPKLYNS